MSHVDDGTLHALIDDALDANGRAAAEAHLATCGECAKRFAEATAMARQVHTLLGALDAVPAPVRIAASTPVRVAALAAANLTPVQQRMRLIHRVALAASVLLVAGISYRVGVSRTTDGVAAAREPAPIVARPAVRPETVQERVQEVADAAPTRVANARAKPSSAAAAAEDAITSPASAEVRAEPRRIVPAEVDVATGAASKAVELRVAPMVAPNAAPLAAGASSPVARRAAVGDVASPAASMQEAVPQVGSTLTGYQMREAVTLSSVTRRRYIAADGTMLMLTITPTITDRSKPDANAVPAFVVSTANGRSTVRWQRAGNSYELQGTVPADSLMTLATQLK